MVRTTLNYFLEPEDGGDLSYLAGTVGEKRRKYHPVEVLVQDIRGREQDFTLDRNGFQLVQHDSLENSFDNEDRITTQYYAECIELVKQITGAAKVKVFGHIIRRRSWEAAFEAEKHLPDDARSVGPSNARFVHCDQSYNSGRRRVLRDFPEEVHRIDTIRWATINVWRPFDHTVTRDALCLADYSSISEDELRYITLRFPATNPSVNGGRAATRSIDGQGADVPPPQQRDKTDERQQADYYARPSDNAAVESLQCAAPKSPDQHKWYYISAMQPGEALLLKISGSKIDGTANRCFHTSFESNSDYGPARHSLEVRCSVIWED